MLHICHARTSRRFWTGKVTSSVSLLALMASAAFAAQPAPDTEVQSLRPLSATASLPTPFRVATFNILGASHTEKASSGFDTYPRRMARTVRLLARRDFSIVGFQEFQKVQSELFTRKVGDTWGLYPGMELGARPVQNSIAWRADQWRLLEKHTYAIPYFGGRMVDQPYVLLENKATGRSVWVMNTHNPADSHGPAQRYRDEAIRREAELVNSTLRPTGIPVLFTGDFNDREDAFCGLLSQTSKLKAANGGSYNAPGCNTPEQMKIDWVFLSKDATPSNYTVLDTPRVRAITDHKVIFTDVALSTS